MALEVKHTEVNVINKVEKLGYKNILANQYIFKTIFSKLLPIAGLTAFVVRTIDIIKTHEQSVNLLNQSLIAKGLYSANLSKEYQDYALSVSKNSVFTQDSIIQGIATLQSYMGNKAVSKELLDSIVLFAKANGLDFVSASEKVGLAIDKGSGKLEQMGLSIDEQATKAERLDSITKQLNTKYSGFSLSGNTTELSINKFNKSFNEFLLMIGKTVSPIIIKVTQEITIWANKLKDNKERIQELADAIYGMSKIVLVLQNVVTGSVKILIEMIIGTSKYFGTIFSTGFEKANKELGDSITRSIEIFKIEKKNTVNGLDQINQIIANDKARRSDIYLEKYSVQNQKKIKALQTENILKQSLFEARSTQDIKIALAQETLKSDHHLALLNKKIHFEEDKTKRLKLELEKRKYIKEKYIEDEIRRAEVSQKIQIIAGTEQAKAYKSAIDSIAQLQGSKYREQIIIGKAAAIAQMTYNTILSAAYTADALAKIPLIGPYIAPIGAALIIAYGAEQVANIAGVDLFSDGSINNGSKDYSNILRMLIEDDSLREQIMSDIIETTLLGAALGGGVLAIFLGDVLKNKLPGPIQDALGAVSDASASIIDFQVEITLAIADKAIAIGGTVLNGIIAAGGGIAEAVKDLGGTIVDLAGGVAGAIGSIIESIGDLFGFAEGGLVSSGVVQPLDNRVKRLEINIKVMGGLSSDVYYAKVLANQVHGEMIKMGYI